MKFNLEQHSTLKQYSENWTFDLDGDSESLENDMINFMLANNGIGLAANQIGLTKRVFVMGSNKLTGFPKPFALFNPEILTESNEKIIDVEGCLSFPNLFLSIKRPKWVIVRYQDSRGKDKEDKFEGYVSKCFQHELDHLNGVCFIDKVSRLKLNLALKKLRKINDRT